MRMHAGRHAGTRLLLVVILVILLVSPAQPGLAARAAGSAGRTADAQANGACALEASGNPYPGAGYCFIHGLIHPATGLVRSDEGDCFTSVYKNALAAMAFIHEGDLAAAGNIFSFFQSRLTTPFPGFLQWWDACTGQPLHIPENSYWEGDNAFLLLALDDYAQVTGSYGSYAPLADALRVWLTARTEACDWIVQEGVADMYAALVPFGSSRENWTALSKLFGCFYDRVDWAGTADHTVRGALVFGDPTGFASLGNFERTQTWQHDENTAVKAYAAFAGDSFINVEISAQIALAWRIWGQAPGIDLAWLRPELEKLRLSSQNDGACAGLPYLVRNEGNPGDYSLPIIDPTAYLVYDYWHFNPFAPGRSYAGCRYDRFVRLVTQDQAQGFPRLYTVGQDFTQFPQEINDGDHRQIAIGFTTTADLAQAPVTLTVATVGRSTPFTVKVKLDGEANHCLDVCDRSAAYVNTDALGTLQLDPACKRTFLPAVQTSGAGQGLAAAAPAAPHEYQLVLEGTSGWGVFDWLQLETPAGVLWTIGTKDNKCSEFDNNGFVYACS